MPLAFSFFLCYHSYNDLHTALFRVLLPPAGMDQKTPGKILPEIKKEQGMVSIQTLAIMIGIQASGKSTFCRNYLPGYDRINLDTLHTRNKENIAMDEAFFAGRNIVIDNTNPTAKDRKKYITKAKEHGYHVTGYFMQSRLKECTARNELREGKAKIPTKAIAATSNRLQMPSYEEGFDELYFVRITDTGMYADPWQAQGLEE